MLTELDWDSAEAAFPPSTALVKCLDAAGTCRVIGFLQYLAPAGAQLWADHVVRTNYEDFGKAAAWTHRMIVRSARKTVIC